jgi:hypothetical protein
LMIGVDGRFSTFNVTTPFAECFHKGIKFLFPGQIPENIMRVFVGEKTDGMEIRLR